MKRSERKKKEKERKERCGIIWVSMIELLIESRNDAHVRIFFFINVAYYKIEITFERAIKKMFSFNEITVYDVVAVIYVYENLHSMPICNLRNLAFPLLKMRARARALVRLLGPMYVSGVY